MKTAFCWHMQPQFCFNLHGIIFQTRTADRTGVKTVKEIERRTERKGQGGHG